MTETNQEIPKAYAPQDWEDGIYKQWEVSGYFNPDNLPGERKETFCTIMPPPNANGRLHAGHGLDMTIKDILTRYKRMQGYKALFLPGADHAGFETQIVYEKKLEKEGRTRFDMKPQELYNNILAFTLENKSHMQNDVRKMGASCDWSREKFTLDEDVVRRVQKTFETMYNDGLIYRGNRIVNWCSHHQTSLSDVETEFKEQEDPFYYIQYGPFVIGTARPETKFGDKYVVVHPDDERYAEYKDGQQFEVEWISGKITATLIKDAVIDKDFGTGVMTITPWHDPIDFELAQRHNLDYEQIIDFDGKLLPIAGEFVGMKIEEAREKLVEKLKEKGLLVKVDNDYSHSVKACYKCATTIEPQIKAQWFVKMKPMAEMAMQPVREGKIQFMPKRAEKVFFHWMNNTIDWNISRQIVWGIPIPAKICSSCGQGQPDLENKIDTCKCGGKMQQDPDTFDTWFSSGQWPLLTLGFPDGKDFKEYYPTDIMETGSDLIFKWIPRMIMFGMYLAKKEPFKIVYLHGMVHDENGQKMSKSKGNVISPVNLSETYGTDAMRMSLIIGNGPGNNLPLSYQKVESYKNFANKLWNIGRYVYSQNADHGTRINVKKTETFKQEIQNSNIKNSLEIAKLKIENSAASEDAYNLQNLSAADQWVLSRFHATVEQVTNHLDNYQLSMAGEVLRDFTWNDFADWYVEIHKVEKNDELLAMIFNGLLRLWHPFMPFITEALWSLDEKNKGKLLMIEKWPETRAKLEDDAIARFVHLQSLITQIRNIRSVYHIDPKQMLSLTLSASEDEREAIEKLLPVLQKLARVEKVDFAKESEMPKNCAIAKTNLATAFIYLEGVIDIVKEKARLEKEIAELARYAASIEGRLGNASYIAKAPAEVVEQSKQTLAETQFKIEQTKKHLENLV